MKWNIFKPRRAIRESVKEGSKKNIVLEDGELMVVRKSADGALVKGVKSDIYIGNGTTTMEELKPALYGDTSEEPITVTPDESPDSTTALNKVTSGKPLSELVGSLKRAIETGGGGGGEFSDIISLDSVDNINLEYDSYSSMIIIYQDEDQEHGIEAVDHTPKKDSYPLNFIVDIYQESETSPTSETFVPFRPDINTDFLYGYYNDNDNNIINIDIPTYYPPNFMYNKLCPYNNQYYKFYYYHNECEIWSNYPLLYTGDSENNGIFIYYYDYELKDNAEANLSTDDFVQYFYGVYSQYHYRAYSFDENTITNFILINPNSLEYDQGQLTSPYESEIIEFLEDQMNLASYNNNGMTYGMIFDFKNSIVYEKYLVIPQWFGLSSDMRFNTSIESCITHPDTTPSIGDFVVYKYKDPTTINLTNYAGQKICKQIGATITIWDNSTSTMIPYYIKDQIPIMNSIIFPNGNGVPAGSIGIMGIQSYEYEYDGTYKIKMHIEYSDNSIVYQANDAITSTEIYDALGYHPIPSEGFEDNLVNFLGEQVKNEKALITYSNSSYGSPYKVENVHSKQILLNMKIKLFPIMYYYYQDNIIPSNRADSTSNYVSFLTYSNTSSPPDLYKNIHVLNYFEVNGMKRKCPYNNKYYRYTYCLRNGWYRDIKYEIFSNYVLIAIKDETYYNGFIYYYNPSSDELVQLSSVPDSDTDFYVQYTIDPGHNESSHRITGDISSGLSGWPRYDMSPYRFGTNMLLFNDLSTSGLINAKSYAKYYNDYSYYSIGNGGSYVYLFGTIDINKKEFTSLDFMQYYDSNILDVTARVTSEGNDFTRYWYQSNASNDPDSPVYDQYATPTQSRAIFFTRTYEVPCKINGSDPDYPDEYWRVSPDQQWSAKDFYVDADHDYIGVYKYIDDTYYSVYMKNLITFDYHNGNYASLAETTDLREEVIELKDMIISSLNGSY